MSVEVVLEKTGAKPREGVRLFSPKVVVALGIVRSLNNKPKRKILDYLAAKGPKTVKEIVEEVFGSLNKYSMVSDHLQELFKMWLVNKEQSATKRIYSLNQEGVDHYNKICALLPFPEGDEE